MERHLSARAQRALGSSRGSEAHARELAGGTFYAGQTHLVVDTEPTRRTCAATAVTMRLVAEAPAGAPPIAASIGNGALLPQNKSIGRPSTVTAATPYYKIVACHWKKPLGNPPWPEIPRHIFGALLPTANIFVNSRLVGTTIFWFQNALNHGLKELHALIQNTSIY